MMIEELVLDHQEEMEERHIQLLSLNFSIAISNIEVNLAQSSSTRERTLLGRIERQVNVEDLERLYFPTHVTGTHWIAGEINFRKKTFAFGEFHV